MMIRCAAFALCLSVLTGLAQISTAQSVVRVNTAPQGFAAVSGTVKGRAYTDYRVKAGAGQVLSVTLASSNSSAAFNILPIQSDSAMFIGSVSGNSASRRIAMTGDYTIRVYLTTAAGRRNESARFKLNITVRGKELGSIPASQDAVIPGTPFHASAEVSTMVDGTEGMAKAFVLRRIGAGNATVEVHLANGTKRQILFVDGKPAAWNSLDRASYARSGEATVVTIGTESITIPDAMVYGG